MIISEEAKQMGLTGISNVEEIPIPYRNTPIGLLLEYHNLDRPYEQYSTAQLLVGMCMDNRKHLHIPDNFSFIIRAGGANMRQSEFKISFAIAIGGVKHIALIGHNQCGMVNLNSKRESFIKGLVENAGWSEEQASTHFDKNAFMSEVGSEVGFIKSEVVRLRQAYPRIMIVPMMYLVEDNKLYLVKED